VALFQFQRFTRRKLWAWLNAPFTGPSAIEAAVKYLLIS